MKNVLLIALLSVLFISCGNNEEATTENTEQVSQELIEQTINVNGMTCEGCENSIEKSINKLEGIASVEASHTDSLVTISFDASKSTMTEIKEQITKTGYIVVE